MILSRGVFGGEQRDSSSEESFSSDDELFHIPTLRIEPVDYLHKTKRVKILVEEGVATRLMLSEYDSNRGFPIFINAPSHPGLQEVTRIETSQNGKRITRVESPYIEGVDLMSLIEEKDPRLQDVSFIKDLLIKLVEAVHFLHSRNIYHRDIRPENIIINITGIPVLIDLECAIQTKEKSKNARARSNTIDGAAIRYASPEMFSLMSEAPGTCHSRSEYDLEGQDLWQIGATFCHVMTSQDPKKIFSESMSEKDKVERIIHLATQGDEGLGIEDSRDLRDLVRSFVGFLSYKEDKRCSTQAFLSEEKRQAFLSEEKRQSMLRWAASFALDLPRTDFDQKHFQSPIVCLSHDLLLWGD